VIALLGQQNGIVVGLFTEQNPDASPVIREDDYVIIVQVKIIVRQCCDGAACQHFTAPVGMIMQDEIVSEAWWYLAYFVDKKSALLPKHTWQIGIRRQSKNLFIRARLYCRYEAQLPA